MDNFLLSLNIVIPVFLIMGLGYVAKALKWLDGPAVKKMNAVIFKIFLPILLCNNIRNADITKLAQPGAFVYAAVGLTLLFGVSMLLMPLISKEGRRTGVLVQGICRANYAFLGLPLIAAMFPGQDTSIASLMVAATVPFYNALSVVALEIYRGGKIKVTKILKNIAKNPLIIGCVVGLVLLLTGVKLPGIIDKAMTDVGKSATPMALFLLGASFSFSAVRGNGRDLSFAVAMKLVVVPIIFVGAAVLMGFRDVALASILIAFGAPTAVSSFTMAQQMDGDDVLAGQIVVFTTLLSVVSLVAFIFVFKQMGLV